MAAQQPQMALFFAFPLAACVRSEDLGQGGWNKRIKLFLGGRTMRHELIAENCKHQIHSAVWGPDRLINL